MPQATYAELLADPRWRIKRENVYRRAGYACEDCGAKGVRLQAHHTYYESGRLPWDYPDDDFRCLCEECHGYFHDVKAGLDRYVGQLNSKYLEQLKMIACRMASHQRFVDADPTDFVAGIVRELSDIFAARCDCGR
jgi:hypothetical protein